MTTDSLQATKVETFTIRLTAADKLLWDSAAKERGHRSLGAFVRRTVDAAISGNTVVQRPSVFDRAAIAKLSAEIKLVGNLLNQLVKRTHLIARGHDAIPPTADDVRQIFTALRALEERVRAEMGRLARGATV